MQCYVFHVFAQYASAFKHHCDLCFNAYALTTTITVLCMMRQHYCNSKLASQSAIQWHAVQ